MMGIFDSKDYKHINKLIEENLSVLRTNEEFNEKYLRLSDVIEEFEENLSKKQREQFNEIMQLVYKTEEYYFILSYSLGVKYGEDLGKI